MQNGKKCQKITNKEYRKNRIINQLKASIPEIQNPKVYEEPINMCREDILSGKQIKVRHSEYKIGKNLFASQDAGNNKTKNQEDSVLILEHPQNKDFKLLAVSDGIGGAEAGEKVSRHIVAKLIEWFENLNPALYNNLTEVQASLNNLLPRILDNLKVPKESGATLSAVIIGKNKTLITNIGDSRVYTEKNGKLNQETRDDSLVQELFEYKNPNIRNLYDPIPDKELMRFHKNSNILIRNIDQTRPNIGSYKIINNTSYDKIIATSDGVTDCISTEELTNIIRASKQEYVASNIVDKALNNNSRLSNTLNTIPKETRAKAVKSIQNNFSLYNKQIPSGKDNTTVAAYIKK